MKELKCHNDILSAVGAQDGSSHASYELADIPKFLVNCVFLISFEEDVGGGAMILMIVHLVALCTLKQVLSIFVHIRNTYGSL